MARRSCPPHRQYYEFRIVEDRALSVAEIASLRENYQQAEVMSTSLVLDVDRDTDPLSEKKEDQLLRKYFEHASTSTQEERGPADPVAVWGFWPRR